MKSRILDSILRCDYLSDFVFNRQGIRIVRIEDMKR